VYTNMIKVGTLYCAVYTNMIKVGTL